MQMHEFGPPGAPAVMLIHGMFQPWQTLHSLAEALAGRYHVLVPALNGHVAGQQTSYHSIEDEAKGLADWLLAHDIPRLHAVCGFSMGGAIANVLWTERRVAIERLVLDGAPLVRCPKLVSAGMVASYRSILKGARARAPKTKAGFEQNFLPEKYWEDFCAVADVMDDASLRNLVYSVGTSHLRADMPANTPVLYLHGTQLPSEMLSRMTAKKLRKVRPQTKVTALMGRGHCEVALREPEKWLSIVEAFLNGGHV